MPTRGKNGPRWIWTLDPDKGSGSQPPAWWDARLEEGKYRSSVDAREPQNPTKSEEYQRHLQGALYSTRGAQTSKTLVTNVVNIQDSQEQAPCATYWFLGLIQVPHEAPVYIVGLPKDR